MFIRAIILGMLLGISFHAFGQVQTLPRRLVLCVDGVSWRDVKALQEGVAMDKRGRPVSAFNKGYYPVGRLVSTFPSCSDVAWTEMLGNEPLPGYSRSYFDISAGKFVVQNGVTSTMEYELQMHFQEENGWARARGYAFPKEGFNRELRRFLDDFTQNSSGIDTYYAMLRTTDYAQHMSADIARILQQLDEHLGQLQLDYRRQTGRDLEILILSDHGNNRGGPGKRLPIRRFLKRAGYRISNSIRDSRDVIVPPVGVQSFVAIHNQLLETPQLVSHLVHLEGVDLIMSQVPGSTNAFLVCDRFNARAVITQNSGRERFKYTMLSGDPLEYGPVLELLRSDHALDSEGFASADAWIAATLQHRYPVALERIARGLSSATLNPATILLSLDNRYVHANFWVFFASRLATCAGTHGGLDDLNSTGITLSNFTATDDTIARKLPQQFAYFAGRNQTLSRAKARNNSPPPPRDRHHLTFNVGSGK